MRCAVLSTGAVHMVGGVAGLAGAWVAGPRKGRFDANGRPLVMPGHNAVLYMSGVLLLWFGFYGESQYLHLTSRSSSLSYDAKVSCAAVLNPRGAALSPLRYPTLLTAPEA